MQDALAKKLGALTPLQAEDVLMLQEIQTPRIKIAAGREVVFEGQRHHSAYILCDGWAYSYKRLPDGGRQVIDIQVPGDFLGLRSLLLRRSDHSFAMLTNAEACKLTTDRLREVFQLAPRLAMALLWAACRDEAVVVEHLVNLGRRDAMTRTIHFLLELGARLKLIGYGSVASYRCPISQSILADALGMTVVHLNRVLRQLREERILEFRKGVVTFIDLDRAVQMTDFTTAYLDQNLPVSRPR